MRQLEFDALLQALRDAVITTRALDIRYLWVDAVCIVQDDGKDKKVEITRMADIYKNETISIAAANSLGAEHGFFNDRPPPKPKPVNLPFLADRGILGTLKVYPRKVQPIQEPLYLRG